MSITEHEIFFTYLGRPSFFMLKKILFVFKKNALISTIGLGLPTLEMQSAVPAHPNYVSALTCGSIIEITRELPETADNCRKLCDKWILVWR